MTIFPYSNNNFGRYTQFSGTLNFCFGWLYFIFHYIPIKSCSKNPYCCYIPIISKDIIGFNPTIYIPKTLRFFGFSEIVCAHNAQLVCTLAPRTKKTRRCRRVQWEFMLSRHEKSWLVVGAVCINNHIYIYIRIYVGF